jgi:metal-responsive CopG/Arc/MetJ family transcriptional regulator
MAEEKNVFVNIQMPTDLQALLDEMVVADESDRSKFIRRLIRQEHGRRQAEQLPLSIPKPARKTRSAQAIAA